MGAALFLLGGAFALIPAPLVAGDASLLPPREAAGFDAPLPLYEVDLTLPDAQDRMRGLTLDCVELRPGMRALVLGWPGAEEEMEAAGLCFQRVRDNAGACPPERRPPEALLSLGSTAAGPGAPAGTVPPFGQGSLAGFWTLSEVNALLDSVAVHDPLNIVTELDTLGYSLQGRPILALGVTDMSRPLGTRPEVLLTSLIHAREPQGMQTVLYFLQRLLAGYGVDPELTYLVREREIWFVPVLNPDGYVRNENTWRNTGAFGYWRKNLRDNNGDNAITSQDGVDLNRNFGFQWGYNNTGSSPVPAREDYRGPGPFSESESQALRAFCARHHFRTADNYHTYYEACLYPWGYQPVATPDSLRFDRIGDAMMRSAQYAYGRSDEILYPVNGEANDWMYGETTEKPMALGFTTEVGNQNDGFWPLASRILPLARLHESANRVLAYAAGVYVTAESLRVLNGPGVLQPGETAPVVLRLRHDGLSGVAGPSLTVRVQSLHPWITPVVDEARFPDLQAGEAAWPEPGEQFLFHVEPAAIPGTRVELALTISDLSGYVSRDTVDLRIGTPQEVFADDGAAGLLHWTATGGWGQETVDGDLVFSDSPNGKYPAGVNSALTLNHGLDLSGATHAALRFRTRWAIETGYDFGWVEASTDSGAHWTALGGRFTRAGHGVIGGYQGGTQPAGGPGYDGNARFWQGEEVDISAYAGVPDLRLRFRLTSDSGVQMAGWLLDDLQVLAWAPSGILGAPADIAERGRDWVRLAAAPNPFREGTRVTYTLARSSPVKVSVYDAAGREVRVLTEGMSGPGEKALSWDGRAADGRLAPAGVYFVRVTAEGFTDATKVLLVR